LQVAWASFKMNSGCLFVLFQKIMTKILLVEDEPELSKVVTAWLIEDHYVVEPVFDGREALECMKSKHYDL
jgi:CheY-like chemotaxis protein